MAVRRFDSSDTESFSIHRVAERQGIPFDGIEEHYDDLERAMLDAFFSNIRESGEVIYIHWNMRDANFGFAAIEQRYAALGGSPIRLPENRRLDLSPLLQQIYGSDYIGHQRFYKLAEKNDITMQRAISGQEEADAFRRKEYVALHQSTLRKVDILQTLAERAYRRTLKTDASWWTRNGGSIRALWSWVVANRTIVFLLGLIGIGLTIWFGFHSVAAR